MGSTSAPRFLLWSGCPVGICRQQIISHHMIKADHTVQIRWQGNQTRMPLLPWQPECSCQCPGHCDSSKFFCCPKSYIYIYIYNVLAYYMIWHNISDTWQQGSWHGPQCSNKYTLLQANSLSPGHWMLDSVAVTRSLRLLKSWLEYQLEVFQKQVPCYLSNLAWVTTILL